MPEKRVCILTFIVLQIIVGLAMPTNIFAQPPWCPDLTNDNFVNFDDFALQANNWLLSGESLDGDFYNNGFVNIYDFDYLAAWWLHGCFGTPPPDICPDCNYPDCNLMDCNVPTDNPCQYCESTPSFIKITISGNRGCECSCMLDHMASWYVDPNSNVDGNYIIPYVGYCRWEGVYHHALYVTGYYPGECCDPDGYAGNGIYDVVQIFALKELDGIHLEVMAYNEDNPDDSWYQFEGIISNVTNCIEGSIANEYICGDYGSGNMSPLWGGGTTTISLLMQGENMNKDSSILTFLPDETSKPNVHEGQNGIMQLQTIALSWLKE